MPGTAPCRISVPTAMNSKWSLWNANSSILNRNEPAKTASAIAHAIGWRRDDSTTIIGRLTGLWRPRETAFEERIGPGRIEARIGGRLAERFLLQGREHLGPFFGRATLLGEACGPLEVIVPRRIAKLQERLAAADDPRGGKDDHGPGGEPARPSRGGQPLHQRQDRDVEEQRVANAGQ